MKSPFEKQETDELVQVQAFYRKSADSYARYWLDYIHGREDDDVAFDEEIENIFSAFSLAADYGLHRILVQGVEGIYHYCEIRGMYDRIQAALTYSRRAAAAIGDQTALARNALLSGRVAMRQERFADAESDWSEGLVLAKELGDAGLICAFETEFGVQAIERRQYNRAEGHLQRALGLAQNAKEPEQIAVLLGELCRVAYFQRRLDTAESYARHGLEITTSHSLPHRTTGLLSYLGIIAESRDDLVAARRHWEEGLALARQVGNLARLSNLLVNLGMLANQTSAWEEAEAYLSEGLEVARRLGQSREISHLLTDLGIVYANRGKPEQAETCMAESLRLAREMGHDPLLGRNLLAQGDFFLARQEWQRAEVCFAECTPLQHSPNQRDQEKAARAFWGLAQAAQGQANLTKARSTAAQSLTIFEEIGHSQADQVREWLEKIAAPPSIANPIQSSDLPT